MEASLKKVQRKRTRVLSIYFIYLYYPLEVYSIRKTTYYLKHYKSVIRFMNEMNCSDSINRLYGFEVDGKNIFRKNVDDVIEFFLSEYF